MAREKEKITDVLAPASNPVLFGHEAAEVRFLEEFARGRPHHAYLMSGRKGIGKATLAYRFARFVLAQKAGSAADAGPSLFGDLPPAPAPTSLAMSADDPLFSRVAHSSHSDLLVLSPSYDAKKGVEKAEISVAEAREVPNFLSLTPAEGEWRVVVVDAVDQLNTNAANALLKILEEPPAKAMLFLICHEPGGILATIRSRCRNFPLLPPHVDAFAEALSTIAPDIERADYPALYALSYGSPGLAIRLAAHEALASYALWLDALQPSAGHDIRAKLASLGAAQKSPEAWAMFLHGWEVAMYRIAIQPHALEPILRGEGPKLTAIAQSVPDALRLRWATRGRELLNVTDAFHLDKKETVRLLLSPQALDSLLAAA